MNLSPSEQRLIDQWRRSEQRWLRWRWIYLVFAALGTIFYAAVLVAASRWGLEYPSAQTSDTAVRIIILALYSPMLWICFLLSTAVLGYTVHRWKGDPVKQLLLKLLAHAAADQPSKKP